VPKVLGYHLPLVTTDKPPVKADPYKVYYN